MTLRARALLLGGMAALALWVTACSGGNAAATSTPAPGGTTATGTATSAAASPAPGAALPVRNEPDAGRAWAHLEMLVNTIGSRPATSANERRAAEYIRDQLTAAGYRATLEEFPVQATLGGAATLTLPDASLPQAAPLGGSANGKISDPVVFAGIGRTSEFAAVDVRGKIAVVDRGELTFGEKVHNAQAAGAAGLIVVNNQPGLFRGDLSGEPTQIPAVSVASETRASLEAAQRGGAATTLEVTTTRVNGTSQNVVGKPSDAPCKAYLGAHYDSVPAGPGANDNGSGTALMIELARARRYDGLCVIAFGSEEVGLFGSKAYVHDHNVGADAMFMMNFDMVAKITSAVVIGDANLTALAKRTAAGQGFEVEALASIGPGSSSDHASFQSAGVPVLMFHSGNDEFIHTDRDNMSNVSQDDLGRFLKAAVAVLDQLLGA